MASVHVLEGGPVGRLYRTIIHAPVPVGNNDVGVSWQDAVVGAGLNVTRMTVGVGGYHITQQEADAIAAGSVLEGEFVWENNPSWTNQQRITDLSTRTTQRITEMLANYANRLRYFGYSTTV